MRTRAYRPEVPGCLEDRSLLSAVAGLSADPVVITHNRIITITEQVGLAFQLFHHDRDVAHLRDEIYDVAVIIPFGRVDGLGLSINRIVNRMQRGLSAHVPHAIGLARNAVIAAMRAEVEARVQAGDVVVR